MEDVRNAYCFWKAVAKDRREEEELKQMQIQEVSKFNRTVHINKSSRINHLVNLLPNQDSTEVS